MTDYSDILDAVKRQQARQETDKMPLNVQAKNFEIFNRWMSEGRSLEEIERKLSEPAKPVVNPALLSVMYDAVRDRPDVIKAKETLDRKKELVLAKLFAADPEYKEAHDEFTNVVYSTYVAEKESRQDGVGAPEVRDDPSGSVPSEKSVQNE